MYIVNVYKVHYASDLIFGAMFYTFTDLLLVFLLISRKLILHCYFVSTVIKFNLQKHRITFFFFFSPFFDHFVKYFVKYIHPFSIMFFLMFMFFSLLCFSGESDLSPFGNYARRTNRRWLWPVTVSYYLYLIPNG